jgi:ankyrin repeat protein
MLEYGAEVNVHDAQGETPLMLVSQWDPRDPTVRHVLEELLAKGADVMATDDKGQTAED